MFAAGVRRSFHAGELLCREGDPGEVVVILLSGYVKLTKTAASGRQTMLELRGPGDVLGDMSVVDEVPRSRRRDRDARPRRAASFGRRVSSPCAGGASGDRAALLVRARRPAAPGVGSPARAGDGRRDRAGCAAASPSSPRRTASRDRDGVLSGRRCRNRTSPTGRASRATVSCATLHELRDAGLVDSGRGRILIRDLVAVRQASRARQHRDGVGFGPTSRATEVEERGMPLFVIERNFAEQLELTRRQRRRGRRRSTTTSASPGCSPS